MMCFDRDENVNYVDENNVVLGFSIDWKCCEDFGHGVFSTIPKSVDEKPVADLDLTPYRFASDEEPAECLPTPQDGGGLAFRIAAPDLPDLWVVIWNHHNGYYLHGWEMGDRRGEL